jgi:hypothetical protein
VTGGDDRGIQAVVVIPRGDTRPMVTGPAESAATTVHRRPLSERTLAGRAARKSLIYQRDQPGDRSRS